MKDPDLNICFFQYKNKIPTNQQLTLFNALKESDITLDDLIFFNHLSPGICLIFSLFLGYFGADRFYIGDIYVGIGKLTLAILSTIVCFTPLFFLSFIYDLYSFIDIFVCYNTCKQKNLDNLLYIIRTKRNKETEITPLSPIN